MTFTPLRRPAPALLAMLLLAACATPAVEPPAADPQAERLLAGMQECLQQQAYTHDLLAAQSTQLEQQRVLLEALESRVERQAEAPPVGAEMRAVVAAACPPTDELPRKLMVGELEQVWLPNLQLALPARIDTGAETSSLDARNIEQFERDGERWVRFEIPRPGTEEVLKLERQLRRTVKILQSNSAESERRPVIRLRITIGHVHQMAEFTLSDRSHLDSQMLIGRNILTDVMIVDVSKKNIAPHVAQGGAVSPQPGGSPPGGSPPDGSPN